MGGSNTARGFGRLVVTAILMAAPLAAFAADRPPPPIEDVKTIADMAAYDLANAIRAERHLDAVGQAASAPFEDLAAVCRQPRNQFLDAMAVHLARQTQAGPRGMPREYERELEVMNRRLRSEITRVGAALAPNGKGVFLEGDETLTAPPRTWGQALRQRAEWTLALNAVDLKLARNAKGSMDFSANYAAGLWALLYCDYSARGADFLKSFAEHGGVADSERDRSALAFLKIRAQR